MEAQARVRSTTQQRGAGTVRAAINSSVNASGVGPMGVQAMKARYDVPRVLARNTP
jgi:hypothetical protein